MANYCRICHENHRIKTNTVVTCNNCGSSACPRHSSWWPDSKNAYCTECFPRALIDALNKAAAGLESMNQPSADQQIENDTNRHAEQIRQSVHDTLERREFSLEQLTDILRSVTAALREYIR